MKNKVIRVISVLMAAGILLSTCGCKANDSKNKKSDSGLTQPDVSNSTAVIEYPTTDANGKESVVTKVADVQTPDVNMPVLGLTLQEKFEKEGEKEQFKKNIDKYKISEKECDKIIDKASDWQTFEYDLYVSNTQSKRVAFRFIKHQNLDGIILNDDLGCEYGMGPGYGMTIAFDGVVDKTKFADEAALKDALSKMGIKLIYAYVTSADDTIDNWETVSTREMEIDFSK